MTEIIQERDGWVLTLEEYRGVTDSYVYKLHPPKWSVTAEVSRNEVPGGETLEVRANADRMERTLVDAILENPVVKQELQRRLGLAEREGFLGAYAEHRNREPYQFKYGRDRND